MPDTRVKVFKGDFPDDDFIWRMRPGERFVWLSADPSWRRKEGPTVFLKTEDGLRYEPFSIHHASSG